MPNIIKIDSIDLPELEVFRLGENALRHYFEPQEGLFIAESPKVIARAMSAGYKPVRALVGTDEAEQSAELFSSSDELDVYVGDDGLLSEIAGFKLVRGVLCAMRRRALPTVGEVCRNADRIAVLERVVNPTNVGAVFRSAAALGMQAVLLSKGCADPLSRRAARVAMGTVFQCPWTFYDDISEIKRLGFETAAMALTDKSISLRDYQPRGSKLAVLLGNENDGLSPETIANCDFTVRIPMDNGVDSLNVAAASAVAFWVLGGK